MIRWSSRRKKSGRVSILLVKKTCIWGGYRRKTNKGKWTNFEKDNFLFFLLLDTGCLSSTTANIDKRQSYIQRKMFLVESGKINVSQRSYLGYSFVAMRWLISSFENCELKRLLKFENEVLQNEIQCIWYIYIYNGIGNVKQFERVSVCFSKKKKKKSIARLKKARETFFE